MGIVPVLRADQIRDVDHHPAGLSFRSEQFIHPRVVTDSVVDDDVGIGDGPRCLRIGREFVRVLVGIGQGCSSPSRCRLRFPAQRLRKNSPPRQSG